MKIRINGKEEDVDSDSTLLELLERKGLNKNKVVVEHNAVIVDREKLSSFSVKQEDIIEIISFVGGG